MYFKRLEMHGFKSFAEPVTIEFHPGITCVIGPNGSGKSNISDAIRWVLGEQSPRMLRGGKMEEVIFSGTVNRKSRGMAEVTLVIDNEKGRLPVDYNEVAITRRMYRSGESEYAINNHQCRLRDIRELIMDTGIGVDGYSLIGQGKISDIVSNKTESRREIFEEAAGIVMYRTKKAESERKLASASSNLERVNDIIGEIEGRIDTLREDSIRASEYIELRERYKELEINITLQNIEQLELKNEYLKDDLMEVQAELETRQKLREKAQRELTNCRENSENLERILTESRQKLLGSVEEINRLVNQGEVSRERLSAIEKDTKRLREELKSGEEKLQREDAESCELFAEKQKIDRKMEGLNQELREKMKEHLNLSDELTDLTQRIDANKNEIFRLNSESNGKKAEKASLQNLQETLQQRKQQILEEKKSGENENRDILDNLNRLKSEREHLQEEISQTTEEGRSLRRAQKAMLAKESALAGNLEELRMTLGQILARKKTIEEMESNYEGYNYAVKFMMKQQIPGICGVTAELITVPEGFETAIETALGAGMQNIICETDRVAQEAIRTLKQSRAGRLTFLPLQSIRGSSTRRDARLESAPGFQGYGVDCISFDSKYTGVMEYLLGRVLVVDTMEHAVALSKSAGGFRLVTLEGEIINAGGAITGGKYRNKTANLLERKAEVTQLDREAGKKRLEQQEKTAQLKTVREELESLEIRLKVLEDGYRSREIDLLGVENQIQTTERVLSDFRSSSGKWEQELEHIEEEHLSAACMLREIDQRIEDNRQVCVQLEAESAVAMEQNQNCRQQLERVNEEITGMRIKAGACETEKHNVDTMASRISSTIQELKREQQTREMELAQLQREKDSLRFDHTDLDEVIREKEEAKRYLEQYLEEVTEEKAAAAARAVKLTDAQRQDAERIDAMQNRKYELEIRKARQETQLDACKEKLWEDFEISYIQAIEFRKKEFDMAQAVKENRRIKARIKELGEVNTGAIAEYASVSERYEFLTAQRADILRAVDSLNKIISDMDQTIQARFKESFDQVVINFESVFQELFGGGHAELRLDDESNPLESGIDIIAQPPGKKLQNINLLSGGEKTMTAIALMFAVLKTKPTPFCILDEVEAALDDANIERFARYLKEFTEIQFTLVTHQKATMEHADVLYGVTMPEQGVSRVLSLNLGDGAEPQESGTTDTEISA